MSSANLTFDDEFDSFASSPDGSTGYRTTYPYGGTAARSLPSNGELEYYSDPSVGENPFSDSNGILGIQASAAAPGSNPQNLPYDSGLATTQGMFQQEYGYFEVSAKLPPGPGMWSGFWLLPYNNLGGAELDIFEILGSYTNRLYTTTHSVNANGVHTADSVPNYESVDLTAAFHTYGVDWEPNQITWYLDGQAVSTQTTPPGFNTPMYMLLNLAIGGFGGTPTDPSAFPATMQVDYLHAYATANTIRVAGGGAHQSASIAGIVDGPAGRVDAMVADLVDAGGNLVASAVTDVNGYFIFTQLAAGTYRVLYEAPAGYAPQVGSAADAIGGLGAPVLLADGQALSLSPETLVAATLGSIGGTVVRQVGANPAAPVSGEAVRLLRSGGVVAATISRADGSFAFSNLAAGTYTVQYTVQSGEMLVAGGPASTKTGLSAAVTLASGQAASLAVQTVSPLPGAVSGLVRYNAAGTQGAGGALLPGDTVSLLDQGGAVVATALTDSNGAFLFSNVLAGQYHLLYASADGYAFLSGSAADPTTGRGDATIFVTPGNRSVASTETYAAAASVASLGGTVLYYDGVHPAAALAGVTVTVSYATGQAVRAVTTDATGAYDFVDLGPGAYQVSFSAPSGDAFQIGGAASFVTGTTPAIVLASGQAYQAAPETLIASAPAAIAGTVLETPTYTAALGTGLALAGEAVSLVGANGLVASTATTDAAGRFSFAGLVPGIYTVRYAVAPATSLQAGGPANVVTATTAAIPVQAGQGVTLAAETLVPLQATITGSVSNNNAPVSYVAVVATDASGAVVASTATNYTGNYSFLGLVAGTYRIRYAAPKGMVLLAGPADPASGLTAGVAVVAGSKVVLAPETLAPAPASVGGTVVLAAGLGQGGVAVAAVSQADGSTAASTTTNADGSYQIAGLAAGSYALRFTVPAGEVLQAGANAGTGLTGSFSLSPGQALTASHVTLAPISPATLGGSVLSSFNGQAAALAGIQVTLLAAGGTLTTTTGSTGAFQFKGLTAGSYQIRYAAPAGDSLQAGGPADPATGLTALLAPAAGQTVTLAPETVVVPPATVTGSVLYAAGGGAGTPEAGVVVSLLRAGTAVASVATDATGAFQFAGLAAGAYQLAYAAPVTQLLGVGGPADPGTGRTAAFTLTPGQAVAAAAETLVPAPGVVAGVVLLQASGAPAPEAGVAVSLLAPGGGAALATTTTDAGGAFRFAGLAPGAYAVGYALPPGQVRQAGGPADVATGLTATLPLAAGQTATLPAETFVLATASVAGSVQLAGASLAGVQVSLMSPAGTSSGAPSGAGGTAGAVLATTTTDASGAFAFTGLVAGSYSVDYTAPAGDALQAGGPADPATGITQPYVLAAAQAVTLPSQGLVALVPGLGGTVVHIGSGDPGTGLGGVTVAVLNTAGTVLRTTLTGGTGAFSFKSLPAGTYRLRYTLPPGEAFSGAGADPLSGTTGPVALASGQALTLTAQAVVSTSTSFTMTGPGGAALRGDGSYVVTGNASTSSLRLGNGNQSVTLTGFSDTVVAGNGNQTITLAGTANSITVGDGTQAIGAGSGLSTVTLGATPTGTTSTVTLGGMGNKVVAGTGSVSVGGSTGATTVTLGDGNQVVTLGGSFNTVTVGAGASTIAAGQNGNVVHAAGGDTIAVSGQGNLLDAGAGVNFYNAAAGSRVDVFMLNGSGQGLTTITGFNASDTLDLARTVAGLGVLADLSNLGHFVTASTGPGGTTLFVDPTGGTGTPYAFATLGNVATSVAQLVAGHNISLT